MFFEVFTDTDLEGQALYMLKHSVSDKTQVLKNKVRNVIKDTLGDEALKTVKKLIK